MRGTQVQGGVRYVALAALIAGAAALGSCKASASLWLVARNADATAALTIEPFPPVALEASRLELKLSDAGGRSIAGANVRLDLTMPEMVMPPNRPEMREVGDGLYRGEAFFTMAGDWQIRAEASLAQGVEQFTFLVKAK